MDDVLLCVFFWVWPLLHDTLLQDIVVCFFLLLSGIPSYGMYAPSGQIHGLLPRFVLVDMGLGVRLLQTLWHRLFLTHFNFSWVNIQVKSSWATEQIHV